jgi:hypothetical protein
VDVYTIGPAGQDALCFTTWQNLLVRANTNVVATCAVNPLVAGNWGGTATVATTEISHSGDTITDLLTYDQYLVIRNNRGLWSFTTNLKTVNELPDLASVSDFDSAGGCYSNGRLLLPAKGGLVGWKPGSWANIGPQQEGATEGANDGWGQTRFCLPYGRMVLTSVNNIVTGTASIVSYVPARMQGRGPLVPHHHHRIAASTFEGMCIVANSASGSVALAVVQVAAGGLTASPYIYTLPLSGLNIADDPGVQTFRSQAATFVLPRVTKPDRSVQKKFRTFECWLDMFPQSNTPGIQVWASVDGGTSTQLLDASGAAKTALTTGLHQFFFPKTAAAVGGWCELQIKMPAKAGGQAALDAQVRECVLRVDLRPLKTSLVRTALLLDSDADLEDHSRVTRDGPQQEAELKALDTRDGASGGGLPYAGPNGESGYVELRDLSFQEVASREGEPSIKVAHLVMEVSRYG